jgi:hypothetical protein
MRDLDRAVPTDAPHAGAQLYVITLLSAPAPLALEPGTALPPHAGLSVFRTRRVRAGREEHLLQFGWFDSLTAAEAMLPTVRRRYPAATVEAAPTGGMGSLDDTMVARFDLARAAQAAGPPGAGDGATGGADARPLPRSGRPIEPPEPAPQRFAVQLAWSTTPFDLQRFGHPDTFAGHVLYRVHSERDGHRWYGLRLGFFRDHLAARLVLQQARRDFALAAVVPVSEREYARVIGAEAARQVT